MTSCTIIISHFESVQFLKTCIRQIRKYAHPEIKQKILIMDQSSVETYFDILIEYGDNQDVDMVNIEPLWSGYSVDYAMRNMDIKTEYICQLHTDAFPIHKNWLYLPIKLIEEDGFTFTGQLHFLSKTSDVAYPHASFFSMSPTFNVAKTEIYKEMAMEGGFTRFHNRTAEFHNKIKMDVPMIWNNDDWGEWARDDYYKRGSDDDTTAFYWEDKYREHNKLGLAITGVITLINREPDFGRVIEDLVFHFGSGNESKGVFDSMPIKYQKYIERIKENYNEELVEELLNDVKPNNRDRVVWNGATKTAVISSEELNKKIEWLKQ